MSKLIIAVDFDGTLCVHEFPRIGEPAPHAAKVLRRWRHTGATLMLWTMRSGKPLIEAVAWAAQQGISFDWEGQNPQQHTWTDSLKQHAHAYVDDAAVGCPTIQLESGPVVDWLRVDQEICLKFPALKG